MARPTLLLLLVPMLAACTSVASLETAVPRGTEAFEPRLLGAWEVREESVLTDRFVVTQEGAAQYLVRRLPTRGEPEVYAGRLGPLGPRRWLLELSPVGDTSQYTCPLGSRDSARVAPPEYPLMVPVHMHLVIERPDSGLRFAVFNGDALREALEAGRIRASYAEGRTLTLLLTEREPRRLNEALRKFADRPGALIPLPRVGHRVAAPEMH